MNNSKGPKIVIAVGLVAVYAAGFAYVMLREKPVVEVAEESKMAPPAPMPAYESYDSVMTDAASSEAEPSPASLVDPAPAAEAPVEAPRPASQVASANSEPVAPPAEPMPTAQAAPAPAGNDSQITAEVRAQIAAVVPSGAIDVSTRDGVVELTGSVPSEAEINRVWVAARNVPDVRSVDVSALMISN